MTPKTRQSLRAASTQSATSHDSLSLVSHQEALPAFLSVQLPCARLGGGVGMKAKRSVRNDPPWGRPMKAAEWADAHPTLSDALIERVGHISARNDDSWYDNQCGGCRFYVPLEGPLGADWGGCANRKSDRRGLVVFEHHGCPEHSSGPGFDPRNPRAQS